MHCIQEGDLFRKVDVTSLRIPLPLKHQAYETDSIRYSKIKSNNFRYSCIYVKIVVGLIRYENNNIYYSVATESPKSVVHFFSLSIRRSITKELTPY